MLKNRKLLLTALVFLGSSLIQVLAMNAFLVPNNVFSGGFNGVAQLLS